MPTYPVVWKMLMDGETATPGRLDIDATGLAFRGGLRGADCQLEIPLTDICGVSRSRVELGQLPTVRIDADGIGVLLFAVVGGIALRSEILEQLQSRIQ